MSKAKQPKKRKKRRKLPREVFDADGKQICGARRKRDGKECRGKPMKNGRCRKHGGTALVGPANGNYKHGLRSKLVTQHLPERLKNAYQATMSDPDAFSLLNEVALIDSRVIDLIQKMDTGESKNAWELLSAAVSQVAAEVLDLRDEYGEDLEPVLARIEQIEEYIRKGKSEYSNWKEITSLMRVRAKMVETDAKRKSAEEMKLDQRDIVAFAGWLVHILVENIRADRQGLSQVLTEIENMFGQQQLESGAVQEAEFEIED